MARPISTSSTRDMPQELQALISARSYYEELFGWPVIVDVERRRLAVTVGQALDAITMPTTLAQDVLDRLRVAMLAGPAITDPGGAWWTFLTAPASASQRRPNLSAELHARKVHLTPQGAPVIIPGLTEDEISPRWITRPQPGIPLPPWSAVIGVARRVVDHRQ